MASVEEVRSGLSVACNKMRESVASLQQTLHLLDEAQAGVCSALQGTTQDDMQEAFGMLGENEKTIIDVQGGLNAMIERLEGYVGRL